MRNLPLEFRPGINRESTNYGNSGGWWDGDKIRFRDGHPESIGGWVRFTTDAMLGVPRSLFAWSTLAGTQFYGIGTHLKYYQISGAVPIDITPIRRTSTPGARSLATTQGSSIVTITDPDHGALDNDFVTIENAGSFAGLSIGSINREHQISAVTTNTYEIDVGANATVTTTGGLQTTSIEYQINIGDASNVFGDGWGEGGWGEGGWGGGASFAISQGLRLWSEDNFGEDLLINVRDGGIYYKDDSITGQVRAVELSSIPGGSDVPTVARQVLVTDVDRHVLAIGTNAIGDSQQDLLLIRFSTQEDVLNWTISTTTSAGSLRIDNGSEILQVIETQSELLVFTDSSLHSVRYIGPPFIFGQNRIALNISLIAPNAAATNGTEVFWMGNGSFYRYDGVTRELECSVEDYVFERVNQQQRNKITSGINRLDGEVFWFMPTETDENDFYVVYNYKQNIWYYGTLDRTAWIDGRFEVSPLATSPDGVVYLHETGSNDASTEPPSAINSWIESSDFEIGQGDRFMLVHRLLPDVTFRSSDDAAVVTASLSARNYQGQSYTPIENASVQSVDVMPNDFRPGVNDIRLRGRSVRYRVESNTIGTSWRQGTPRLAVQPDGRR